jgi:rubrerythrin
MKKRVRVRGERAREQIGGKLHTGAVIGHHHTGIKKMVELTCYNCGTVVHKPQQCPRCGVAIC